MQRMRLFAVALAVFCVVCAVAHAEDGVPRLQERGGVACPAPAHPPALKIATIVAAIVAGCVALGVVVGKALNPFRPPCGCAEEEARDREAVSHKRRSYGDYRFGWREEIIGSTLRPRPTFSARGEQRGLSLVRVPETSDGGGDSELDMTLSGAGSEHPQAP